MKRLTPGMVAAVLIAFFTLAAAAVISDTVFERLPHLEDEFAYLYQAKIFAGGHAWVVRNEPVKYFWQPFVIQPETSADGVQKRFGKYTPGWPLLLSIGVILGQPWVVNGFLAMLTVALVYRMGREIFSEPVGLVSALLLAISPMALLLNATLMSHVSAMFMAAVFVYAYWRVTRNGRRRFAWAIAAGLALGWIISTRPLTAVAIAAPVALHAVSRVLDTVFEKNLRSKLWATLAPLIVLAVFVLPTGALWPVFNQIWTGDYRTNVYTLLWPYDVVGFGPGHGLMEGGHTLEYGWRNARTDLVVYQRDLFGFTLNPGIAQYLAVNLFGLTSSTNDIAKTLNENVIWGMIAGLSWIPVAVGLVAGRKREWIWLFFELFVAIVLAQLTYWIGSVVYGTAAYSLRYYYEATFGVCIVAGYGVVALARWLAGHKQPISPVVSVARVPAAAAQSAIPIDYLNGLRSGPAPVWATTFVDRLRLAWRKLWPGYILLLVACAASLAGYTPARFKEPLSGWPNGLFRYNEVGRQQIEQIEAMRAKYGKPGQPVLIIVLRNPNPAIEDNWRDYGAAMALTSPYLDSDIIVVRVFEKEDAPEMIQRFPGRLVLYQIGPYLYPTVEDAIAGATQKAQVDNTAAQ